MRYPAGKRAAGLTAVTLALLLPGAPAPGQEAFRLGDIAAEPGHSVSGRLDVAPLGGDAGTHLPLTVVHGAHPGPVLTLVAGIHGSEYAPIWPCSACGRS